MGLRSGQRDQGCGAGSLAYRAAREQPGGARGVRRDRATLFPRARRDSETGEGEERERDEKSKEADQLLVRHHGFANAVALFQIAIALGAVAALTRAIAIDHVGDNIRCNAVAPGTIETPYFDDILKKSADPDGTRKALAARQLLGRLGTPEEIAAGILFLASDESRFATGTILTLDGGMTAQ